MKLSHELQTLEEVFQKHGLLSLLVGGGARTYLTTGILAADIDLEIRSKTISDHDDYLRRLETAFFEAGQALKLNLEPLAFSVMRLRGKDFEVECAPARQDLYGDERKVYGHKDFTAVLLINPTDEQAFLRRDFTINAMGVELHSGRVADPFQGEQDLAKKILRTENPDFKKDPLRFLRAFRFATTLELRIGPELESELKNMDLSKLEMSFYFREAFKKAGGGRFLQSLFLFLEKERLQVHESVRPWFFLKNLDVSTSLLEPHNFWGELSFCHQKDLDPLMTTESLKFIESSLGLKRKMLQDLSGFAKYFLNWSLSDFEQLKNLSFEQFALDRKHEELSLLVNHCHSLKWEEKLDSNSQKTQLLQRLREFAAFLKSFKVDYQAFQDDLKQRGARKLHTALKSFN